MANIAAIDTPNSSWTSCNFAEEVKLVFAGYGHDVCKLGEFIPIQSSGVYLFDVTKLCAVKSSCYDFSKETSWLNNMANIAAIDTPKY